MSVCSNTAGYYRDAQRLVLGSRKLPTSAAPAATDLTFAVLGLMQARQVPGSGLADLRQPGFAIGRMDLTLEKTAGTLGRRIQVIGNSCSGAL